MKPVCYVCEEPAKTKLVSCPVTKDGVECGRLMHPTKDCSNRCKSCESYLCHVHKKRFKSNLDDDTGCDMRGGCCLVCSRLCKTCGFRFTWDHYSYQNHQMLANPAPDNCEYCIKISNNKCISCDELNATVNNLCYACFETESGGYYINENRASLIKDQLERDK